MQVEVNEENIERFGLVELTGNSKEHLLAEANHAHAQGTILYCKIPDELIHLNAFEVGVDNEPADEKIKHDGGADPFGKDNEFAERVKARIIDNVNIISIGPDVDGVYPITEVNDAEEA